MKKWIKDGKFQALDAKAIKELSEEDSLLYLEAKFLNEKEQREAIQKSIDELKEGETASAKQIADLSVLVEKSNQTAQDLVQAAVKQGLAIAEMQKKSGGKIVEIGTLAKAMDAQKDEIKSLMENDGKRKSVQLVLDTKATQTYGDIDAGEDFAVMRAGVINQPVRRLTFRQLFRNQPIPTQFYKYTEQDTVVRDAQNVAKCSPVVSTTKETLKVSSIEAEKVKDIITACLDFLNDYDFMRARINTLLVQSISLKTDQQLLLGTGVAPQLNSIDSVSSEFNAANAACNVSLSIQAANYVDLVSAMATQVFELGLQNSFIPNVAIVNNCDWFLDVASAKDLNNNYLDQRVVVENGQTFIVTPAGLMLVVTSPLVAQNTCYVMDSTKGEIIDRQQLVVDIAFENGTDWESDLVSIKGSERLNLLVPNEWSNAFMKCSDVATAITAITKV